VVGGNKLKYVIDMKTIDEITDWWKRLTKTQQTEIMNRLRDSVVYFGSRAQTNPKKWFLTLPDTYKFVVHNTCHLIYKKKSKGGKENGSNRIPREHSDDIDID